MTTSAPDPEPWLRLVHAPGVGPAQARELLARFPDAASACAAAPAALAAAGLSAEAAEALRAQHPPEGVARDQEWAAAAADRHLLTLADPRYPTHLAAIADPPPVLYVHGDPEVLTYPALAIVGTRHPTPAGQEIAHDFARDLASHGLVVVSGLALGIDGAAHTGALAGGGLTVAAAGTGLDRIYPARHQALARRIATEGALVSELPVGTRPSRSAFPRRNRILSGLCVGTLVVEAAVRSRSLITARLATEQDREVFAIPGSIHNPVARGCHQIIRQGAKLVETAEDVLEELAPLLRAHAPAEDVASASSTPTAAAPDDPEYARLFACLDWEPRGIDDLAARSGLAAGDVASMLLRLGLEGHIRTAPGGLYQRV